MTCQDSTTTIHEASNNQPLDNPTILPLTAIIISFLEPHAIITIKPLTFASRRHTAPSMGPMMKSIARSTSPRLTNPTLKGLLCLRAQPSFQWASSTTSNEDINHFTSTTASWFPTDSEPHMQPSTYLLANYNYANNFNTINTEATTAFLIE